MTHTITFHRMGAFLEAFDDDAAAVAKTCGITLTKNRAGRPMAGIPVWAAEDRFAELRAAGFEVVNA